MAAPIHPDDAARLAALRRYDLLDGRCDEQLDALVRLAALVCEAPGAAFNLVEEHRQVGLAVFGPDASDAARCDSFCAHAILSDEVLVVADTQADERFAQNPMVLGDPHLRAYAGAPVITSDGHAIGALCVVDDAPRGFSPTQLDALHTLARQAMTTLELRRDVRERRRTELALHEAEQRFRTAFEHAPTGIALLGLDGSWLQANPSLARMLGYDVEGLLALGFGGISHPDELAGAHELLRQLRSGEMDIVERERRYRHRDGREVRGLLRAVLVRDGAGQPQYLIAQVQDISAEREAVQELEDQRDFSAALLRSIEDGMVIVDDRGTIVDASRPFCELVGRELPDVVGCALPYPWWPEADLAAMAELVAQPSYELDVTFERPDGTRVPVLVTRTRLSGADEAEPLFLALVKDITERTEAEARRERLLEQEREQLARMLEVDRLKDEFVSLVSHELRTPLTSITGFLQLVLEDAEGFEPQQQRFLATIERNTDRLTRLVGDLLDLSRVEADRMAIERRPLALAGIVADAVEAIDPAARAKQIVLECELGGGVEVDGDPVRLHQVVDNLLSNAVKYTPAGGRVEVRLARTGDLVELTVADTGIGIPEQELGRLFERFWRSSEAVAQAIPGTGLGLAITRAIVAGHGGTIAATPRAGGGTVLTVRLPAGSTAGDVAAA